LTYRLLGGAEEDIDRILLRSAREWGFEAAARYDRLMRAVFSVVGASPALPGSRDVAGARVYPLRLGRRLVSSELRVSQPRHLVVYRVATDGVVEILGLAHDRMLLDRAARRMQREAKG
jgi:toxin ParE1/3/4